MQDRSKRKYWRFDLEESYPSTSHNDDDKVSFHCLIEWLGSQKFAHCDWLKNKFQTWANKIFESRSISNAAKTSQELKASEDCLAPGVGPKESPIHVQVTP